MFLFFSQVAQGVQDTLLSINLFNVDLPTQKEVTVQCMNVFFLHFNGIAIFSHLHIVLQIDLFIQAIEMNPAVVSLKGYADVNRELLSSVYRHFGSSIIYDKN